MNILFKYKHNLPDFIYDITDSITGYSKLDDKPIYKISFDINESLINDLLYNSTDRLDYMDNLYLYLRKEKTNKLLNNITNKELDKFNTFLQYYYDNIIECTVLKSI